jgi:hypothetical protein
MGIVVTTAFERGEYLGGLRIEFDGHTPKPNMIAHSSSRISQAVTGLQFMGRDSRRSSSRP